MTNITPEEVAGLVKRLRDFDPHDHELETVDESADMLEALAALPADDRVAKLVVAAKAALKWLDDDLGVSSEAQPERQNLRSALSALEAGE
jgi:hypothetical protein